MRRVKAIEAFDGGLWVILGGSEKGSDYYALREPLKQRARAAILIGAAAAKMAAQLEGWVAIHPAGTLERAIEYARRQAQPGDTVLLAPACASFDQFQNYGHRGRVFKQLVGALAEPWHRQSCLCFCWDRRRWLRSGLASREKGQDSCQTM